MGKKEVTDPPTTSENEEVLEWDSDSELNDCNADISNDLIVQQVREEVTYLNQETQ